MAYNLRTPHMDNHDQSPAPVTSDSRPPVTDSPWFWLFLFGGMGIVALAAIAPKYLRRQTGIERQYTAREAILERQAKGTPAPADAPAVEEQPPRPGSGLLVPLAPVGYVIAILLSVALLARVVIERRRAARQVLGVTKRTRGRR